MHDNLNKHFIRSILPTPTNTAGGPVDFNATGDKFLFPVIAPIEVVRFGIVTIELMDPDAGGFVLSLEKRVTVGSDTDRVVVDVLTRANAETVAAGGIVYRNVELPVAAAAVSGAPGIGGQSVYVGPSGPGSYAPGDEVVLEVTNAVGAASTGYVWFEYIEKGFDDFGYSEVNEDVT